MRSYTAINIFDELVDAIPDFMKRSLITVSLISEMCHVINSGDLDSTDRGALYHKRAVPSMCGGSHKGA